METLSPGTEALTHLLASLQKVRSISAENGTSQMHADFESLGVRVPLSEKMVENDRTLELLVELVNGDRDLEPALWMNLAHLVHGSARWSSSLAVRGVEMPDPIVGYTEACELARASA